MPHAHLLAVQPDGERRVLRALIGMMNQSFGQRRVSAMLSADSINCARRCLQGKRRQSVDRNVLGRLAPTRRWY